MIRVYFFVLNFLYYKYIIWKEYLKITWLIHLGARHGNKIIMECRERSRPQNNWQISGDAFVIRIIKDVIWKGRRIEEVKIGETRVGTRDSGPLKILGFTALLGWSEPCHRGSHSAHVIKTHRGGPLVTKKKNHFYLVKNSTGLYKSLG
jgi:hypothetical protein